MENAEEHVVRDVLHHVHMAKAELKRFKLQIANKDAVVCLGNSRTGKSALVNYIQGNELEAFTDSKRSYIKESNPKNYGPIISHGSVSYTKLPTVWEIPDQLDTVIVDLPGFDDNRGVVRDIVNTLFFNQLKHSRSVRFILVSDINDIDNDNVRPFTSAVVKIQTIINDFNELKDSVSVIFTKDCKNYTTDGIAAVLKKKIVNVPEMQVKKELVYHIIKNPKVIGIWKMPPGEGVITMELEDNIRDAIYNTHPIILNTADIKFQLSEQAHYVLLEVYQKYCVKMNFQEEVNKIIRRFNGYFAIDKYVFASTEGELFDTKTRLQYALTRITTEKCKTFTNISILKSSLCFIAGTLDVDFERKLNFFVFTNDQLLLDENIKNMIIVNYKNALSYLENEINRVICKIDHEVLDRTQETVQYIVSEAFNDRTKLVLMGTSLIPVATKALSAVGIELPKSFSFQIVTFSGSSCALAGAGAVGVAAGGYGVLYYKSIYLRKQLRQQQGR